jgi:hypothetical protein
MQRSAAKPRVSNHEADTIMACIRSQPAPNAATGILSPKID